MSAGKRFYREPKKVMLHHDLSSQAGAKELASAIESYWIARGYPKISVSVNPLGVFEDFVVPFYGLQSNIGPTGFPPR